MAIYAPQSSSSKKKSGVTIRPPKADDSSILRDIGSVGLSGLHTAGSILSTPSRVIWGGVNAALGGEGGWGNLDPFDMTGGIQLSDVLANQGVIAKNDPTQWEWMDPVRGLIDIGGDPTTYAGIGGLTRAGQAAAKAGGKGLQSTITGQIKSGQRGLVSVGLPFRPSAGAFGTGRAAAKAVAKVERAGAKIRWSGPGRLFAKHFDYRVGGEIAEKAQRANLKMNQAKRAADFAMREHHLNLARNIERLGLSGDEFRSALEVGHPDPTVQKLVQEHRDFIRARLQEAEFEGTVQKGVLQDNIEFAARRLRPDVMEDINPARQKIRDAAAARGETVQKFRAHTARDVERMWYLKGDSRGTNGIESVLRDPEIDAAVAEAVSRDIPYRQTVDEVTKIIEKNHGQFLERDYAFVNRNGEQVVRDRYQKLAELLVNSPGLRKKGLFGNHPVKDSLDYGQDLLDRHYAGRAFYDMAADVDLKPMKMVRTPTVTKSGKTVMRSKRAIQQATAEEGKRFTLASVLSRKGFTKKNGRLEKALQQIWARKNPGKALPVGKKWAKARRELATSTMSGTDYTDLLVSGAGATSTARGMLDTFNALFKASVLSRPARVFRDYVSGVVQNVQGGNWGLGTQLDAWRAMRGQALKNVEDYVSNPEIAQFLQMRGVNPADEQAVSDAILQAFAGLRTTTTPMASELMTSAAGNVPAADIKPFIRMIPGALQQPQSIPEYFGQGAGEFLATTIGRSPDDAGNWAFRRENINPLNVAGAFGKTETKFGPAKAYEAPLAAADMANRLQPWLERIKRGERMQDAMDEVNRAQVNYDPKTFTPSEQQLRKLLPFYSFFSRQIPYLMSEVAQRPGGGFGTSIKAAALAGEEDPLAPAHISNTLSIPVPTNLPGGERQYLTGLGLMMEDPLQFGNLLKGDVTGALSELGGRVTPAIKAPTELVFGETLFQKGFSGGRELDQMDPGAGRILSNIGQWTGLRDQEAGPVQLPGGTFTEHILSNSPLAGPLSLARQATDTRTGLGTKATNLLTGSRVATVSRSAQQAALREKAQILAKGLGAKEYAKVYFPPELLDTLKQSDPIRAAQADAINALLKELASNARQAAKERAQKKGSQK